MYCSNENIKIQKRTWLVSLASAFLLPVAYGQSPTPTATDVISQVIEQAAKETFKTEKSRSEEAKLEPWQTSPDEFAKELQRLFSKGADESELAKRFHGKQVDWPGILDIARTERKLTDPNVTLVAVWITDVPLVAPDGSPAHIGELALDIPKFVMPADKHVRVRATLSNLFMLPVINEKNHSKQTAIGVETEGNTGTIVPLALSETPSPGESKTLRQMVDESLEKTYGKPAVKDAKKEQPTRQTSAATSDTEDWCDKLLKAPIDKNLPEGYSNPKVSLTEMTPEELAGGMICKISVTLHGPDPFNFIRFRVFNSVAAAERGLKSLPKLVPEISVYESQPQLQGRDTPCMVYTSGNRKLTFISCADQIKGSPVVISGVSSQPNDGESYDNKLVFKAADLLEAAEHHCASIKLDQNARRIAENNKATRRGQLEPWQTSPDEFAKEVQRLFSKGADENELAKRFHGKQVDWPGILDIARTERKLTDPNVTFVPVWITDVPLVAPDGSPAYIGQLALDIPKFVMPADKHVRVRATLSTVSTMPVINERDHSKKTVVIVETEGDTGTVE